LSMAHSRYSVTLFMRSPTMLNDCGGPSSARGAGGDTAPAAASTSPTPTALRHRPSRPVMSNLLVVASDAQREEPVHRLQHPGAHAPARRIGLFAAQREVALGGPVGLAYEVVRYLEERHVGHDVPRAEVDRGKKAHHRGPDQEHGGGHEQHVAGDQGL